MNTPNYHLNTNMSQNSKTDSTEASTPDGAAPARESNLMNKPHLEFQYMMRELIHHPAQLAGILDKKPIMDRAPFLAVLRHWQEVGEPNQEDWRAMCERDDLQEIRQRICSDLDGLASYFGVDKSLLANVPEGTAIWSIGLFADFIAQWWVVLVVGTLLVSASVMNSFALMRVNANMAVLRQELRAMQTMQQAQQESGQQSQRQP